MKTNKYQHAVDHLKFSDDLYERVVENGQAVSRTTSIARMVAIAAVITGILATTALAVGGYVKNKLLKNELLVPIQTLGTVDDRFEDALRMEFTLSDKIDGVQVHYMELEQTGGVTSYRFRDGLLWGGNTYYCVTEDYQLENLKMYTPDAKLEKGGWLYQFPEDYTYGITDIGVVSKYHDAAVVNAQGEILTHVYRLEAGMACQVSDIAWPVYLNVETGQIRDALPQFSPEDFPVQSVYVRNWKGGLLIGPRVNGENLDFYWVPEGSTDKIVFSIPATSQWIPGKDTIYYADAYGNHYCLNENFQQQSASPYNTYGTPGAGLLEVMTDDYKLGIYDLQTGLTYVFHEIEVNRGSFEGSCGYYTSTSSSGRVALIKSGVAFEPRRTIIEQIGILDVENRQLRLLNIENGYTRVFATWLDGDRLGVIYENEGRQYLCIYEFE